MVSNSEREGTHDRDLTLAERTLHSQRLIKSFRKALAQADEFRSRVTEIVLDGEDTKKDVIFQKGTDIFALVNNVISEGCDTFGLKVFRVGGLRESIALMFEKQQDKSPARGSSIRYAKRHESTKSNGELVEQDTHAAVEGAEAILRRLKHRPILSRVFLKT